MYFPLVFLLLGQYSGATFDLVEKEQETTESYRKANLVATPHWSGHSFRCRDLLQAPDFEQPPFITPLQREDTSSTCCKDGTEKGTENSLEVCPMLETLQARGCQLPSLQATLEESDGPYLCASTSSTAIRSDDLCTASSSHMGVGPLADRSRTSSTCLYWERQAARQIDLKRSERAQAQKARRFSLRLCAGISIAIWRGYGSHIPFCDGYDYASTCSAITFDYMESTTRSTWSRQRAASSRALAGESGNFEELLPEPCSCTTCNPRHDRACGKGSGGPMESCHGPGDGKGRTCPKNPGRHERGQRTTQSCMDHAPTEQPDYLEGPNEGLSGATKALRCHDCGSPQADQAVRQHCFCFEPQGYTGSSCCQDGRRSIQEHGGRERKGQHGRETPIQSTLTPSRMCGPHLGRRSYRGGIGHGSTEIQKGKIFRSQGRTRSMSLGSALLCLSLNTTCLPEPPSFKAVRFPAEAYLKVDKQPLDRFPGAACRACPKIGDWVFHTNLLDPECVHVFDAIALAHDLQGECILEEAQDELNRLHTMFRAPLPTDATGGPDQHGSPRTHRTFENDVEEDWHVPGDAMAGHIPNIPISPLHLQAEWIQQLSARWSEFQSSPFAGTSEDFTLRTWYLHPERYPCCRTWRMVRMPANHDHWLQQLGQAWFDLIEHDRAVEFHLVSPDVLRDPHDRVHLCDVILAQDLEPHHATAVNAIRFLGYYNQVHLEARIMPLLIGKWEFIFLLELDRFCGGPAWDVSFHRLCNVWRDHQLIRPDDFLFPVHYGDSFTVDLHPPVYIDQNEDDELALLAQQPHLLQPQPPPDDQDDYAEDDSPQDETNGDRNVVDDTVSVIILTRNAEGVIGRIQHDPAGRIYSQAAEMMGISENRLLRLYDLPSPPDDLREAHDRVWMANRMGDIDQGSDGKLVLLDVKFCEILPRLQPEVVRQVKVILTPSNRQTLLKLLGLEPYCANWPCLMHLNHELVPHRAPFSLRHGDYLSITISPPEPHICGHTRLAVLALHHGLTIDAVPDILQELPSHMDIDQIPNPDVELTELEFDMPRLPRLELYQSSVELIVPTKSLRLDETEHIRNRIDETVAANELLREGLPTHDLDQLPDSLQGLFDPWNEIAATWTDQTHWAPVAVWYISHLRWRICTSSRIAWLSDDLSQWETSILATWQDQIDQNEVTNIAIARPMPHRREPHIAAHVIVIQHHIDDGEHAALVTLQDDGFREGRVDRQAMVMPNYVSHAGLLVVSNRLQDCLARPEQLRCRAKCGTFELTHEAMIGWPGCAYTVLVERLAQIPAAPFSGTSIFPVAIDHNAPRIIRELHTAFVERRDLQPHQPINLRIISWFLDHQLHKRCLYGRSVDLPLNPNQWVVAIIQQWPDYYDPSVPVEGFLVVPTPSTMLWQTEETFHVIVHQRPSQDHNSVLTTTFDQTNNNQNPPGIQRAIVVPAAVTREHLLQATDLEDWCLLEHSRRCDVSYGPTPIRADIPFECRSGASFRIFFTDTPPQVWTNYGEGDDTSLLQLRAHPPQVPLDLAPATSLSEQLDTHYFLPQHVLPRPTWMTGLVTI